MTPIQPETLTTAISNADNRAQSPYYIPYTPSRRVDLNATFDKHVPGNGPLNASICAIGEAPWISEAAHEPPMPFAGSSGFRLSQWLEHAGLSREQIRVENVHERRPKTREIKSVPPDILAESMIGLHDRIARTSARVLVPMGNFACYTLTGKGTIPKNVLNAYIARYKDRFNGMPPAADIAEKEAGISKLRGSLYAYRDLNGRVRKVIPCLHPAAVNRRVQWQTRCLRDWAYIAEHAAHDNFDTWDLNINVDPSDKDIAELIDLSRNPLQRIAVDIETPGNRIQCVGFAFSPTDAIVIRTSSLKRLEYHKPALRRIMHNPAQKVLQNGYYDYYWLRELDIYPINYLRDTLCEHHALDPCEEHSLEFLASYFLRGWNFHKDEAKTTDDVAKYVKHMHRLYHYNGKDCISTYNIDTVLTQMLVERDMWDFYIQHYAELFSPLLETMLHGVRVNRMQQSLWAMELLTECNSLRERLKQIAGYELYATEKKSFFRKPTEKEWNALLTPDYYAEGTCDIDGVPNPKWIDRSAKKSLNYIMKRGVIRDYKDNLKKDFSDKKLMKFFTQLGLPKVTKAKIKDGKYERIETVDESALRSLAVRFPDHAPTLQLILDHREKKKETEVCLTACDADDRMRCSYKLNTDQARLASSKNPRRTGRNLQNIKRPRPDNPRSMRETFLPDTYADWHMPDNPDDPIIFLRADLSQVEDREVKMYTGDAKMVEIANRHPAEYDAHTANATAIFNISEADVDKEKRYLGKRAVHASQRGMHGEKLAKVLLKDGYVKTPKECQNMIDRYLNVNWQIRDLYFPLVRNTVMETKALVNSWGRVYDVSHFRLNEDLYRRCYSFWPQCVDGETEMLIKDYGFIQIKNLADAWHRFEIAVWDKDTQKIHFEKPSAFHVGLNDSEMVAIEGTRISQCVTPNHRVGYYTAKNFIVKEAQQTIGQKRLNIPVAGNYKFGKKRLTQHEIVILAAVQADGTIRRDSHVEWHISKERKITRLLTALTKAKKPYKIYKSNCDKSIFIQVNLYCLHKIFEFLSDKVFTYALLKLNRNCAKALVNEIEFWDGHRDKKSVNSFWYDSTIKQNVDCMQVLATLIGCRAYQTVIQKANAKHRAVHRVYITSDKDRTMALSSKHIEKHCAVYCPTVSTGFFVIRRNGKVSITGNSEDADLLNNMGLKRIFNYIIQRRLLARLNLQVHDEVIVSTAISCAYEIAWRLTEWLSAPRYIYCDYLSVPVGITLATSWSGGEEFKRLPDEKTFNETCWKVWKERK